MKCCENCNCLLLKKVIHYLLLIVAALTVLTGLGVDYYQEITSITGGLLDKATASKIHDWIWIPFVILFAVHVLLPILCRKLKK